MTSVWGGIKATISAGINWIIDKVNGVIDSINSVSGSVGMTLSKVPRVAFQTGGIVPGHAFQTGGILPGGRNPASHDKIMTALDPGELILNRSQQGNLAEQIIASDSRGGGSTPIVISVTGNSFFGSDQDFAEKVGDAIFSKFNTHTALPGF